MMRVVLSIFLGLLYGVLIVFLSVILSGAGDGWNGALRYGVVALVACPVVAVSLTGRTHVYTILALTALLVGLIVDVLLSVSIHQEFMYFKKVIWLAVPWIGLMLFWQILAVISLMQKNE